ncbi:Arc family DNA-binding protein [Fulvimarina sp. MAC3]|uniref:Arc family DNA-binding protein n=1 Tax=Fulvimarina sp. MAC3 TaxID=3148887 RepID=UPI0031FC3A1A
MSKKPTQPQDKYVLRLPDGMRDRIKAAADANNRSMNAEIVALLDQFYPEPQPEMSAPMREIEDILLRRRMGRSFPGEFEALPRTLQELVLRDELAERMGGARPMNHSELLKDLGIDEDDE